MEEPEITSIARPLSKQEKSELGPVNFAEQNFLLGLLPLINGIPAEIPAEIGRLYAARYTLPSNVEKSNERVREEITLTGCVNFVTKSALEGTLDDLRSVVDHGFVQCADPNQWTVSEFKDSSLSAEYQ